MKAKCKIWVDGDGDVILRIRKGGHSLEYRIARNGSEDWISRNDVEASDPIMGLSSASLYNELKAFIQATHMIRIGDRAFTPNELEQLTKVYKP